MLIFMQRVRAERRWSPSSSEKSLRRQRFQAARRRRDPGAALARARFRRSVDARRIDRAVRVRLGNNSAPIVGVAHNDLPVVIQLVQCLIIREITALAVGDRHSEQSSF